jgi:tetratricopeptide (TPR) repeat protein
MLSKEEDISLLLSAYNALGETLDGLGKYNELRTMATAWKSVLDQYQKKALAKGYTPALSGRYLYCTLAAAVAEIETRHYPQAAQLLKQAEKYAEGRKQIARFKLLQVESRYYAATKQYDKAIACNSENMKIVAEAGDSVSLLTVEEQQGRLSVCHRQIQGCG